MWTAFPPSDYYDPSAPPRRHQPATGLPAGQQAAGRGGTAGGGSHVHHQTVRRGRRPAIPLRPRHGYPAALHRGLPTGDIEPAQEFPAQAGARRNPAQIRQVGAGGSLLRGVMALVPHVHLPVSLAGPGPSDGAGPSRLCQGCLPLSPTSLGSGCPQLHQPAATDWRRCPFTTARSNGASWRSTSPHQATSGRSGSNRRPSRSGAGATPASGLVRLRRRRGR